MWLWAEAIACYSLCTGAAEARVEARADVAGARERLCTGLSLRLYEPLPRGALLFAQRLQEHHLLHIAYPYTYRADLFSLPPFLACHCSRALTLFGTVDVGSRLIVSR